jgi:hypothetical protein
MSLSEVIAHPEQIAALGNMLENARFAPSDIRSC